MYSHTSATIITPDGQSDPFDITASVMQGDTLSHFLFVVVVDYNTKLTVSDPNAGFRWKRGEGSRTPVGHIPDFDYAEEKKVTNILSFYRTSSTPDASTSYDSVLWFLAALWLDFSHSGQ